ncbi:hypothetical protein [Salinibacter ruber]|uniref:hypothetical protein n=1 Tax=Salinibacter ruber TaxID=146919 RepID=UPI002168F247|nr:hypothetical protein [Salinibacter ruber]MCS4201835.1 hypothetical protein [Salinibacter ruber]
MLVALLLSGVVASSSAQVTVRGPLSQEQEVAPGDTYEGTIVLYNQGDSVRTAEVSLQDYLFNYQGQSQYLDPGSHDRSNAPWIDYGSSTVTIPPEQEANVEYEIQVPDTTSGGAPTGTYWGMMIVEPLNQNPNAEPTQGIAVQQVRRYGIQVVTHIQDTGNPSLEILSANLTSEEEQPQLHVDVKNMGTRSDRPSARLELYDESGELAMEQSSSPKRIYPNTSVRYRLDLSDLSPGEYQALLVLESESGRSIGRQFSVNL